jgi:putative spermidine/putrescine transport system permease protein
MGVQDWPFSAVLSLIFTVAVVGIVILVGTLSRRIMRGIDAA